MVPSVSDLSIRVSSSEGENGGSIHKVKRTIVHKGFNEQNVDYDFSLLELDNKIEFSEKAKPIVLIGKDQNIRDNAMCLVTGWGLTQSTGSNAVLRGVEIPIVNQQKCNESYNGEILLSMLCAGFEKGGKGTCQRNNHLTPFLYFYVHLYSQFNACFIFPIDRRFRRSTRLF